MNKNIIPAVLVAAIGLAYVVWAVGTPSGNNSEGDSLDGVNPTGDLFEGKITNKNVVPGKMMGTGVYDKSCVSIGGGLTNCHAGIKTDKYGVIDFNYEHDMAKKPCVAPNQKVVVEILDSAGNARVQRI